MINSIILTHMNNFMTRDGSRIVLVTILQTQGPFGLMLIGSPVRRDSASRFVVCDTTHLSSQPSHAYRDDHFVIPFSQPLWSVRVTDYLSTSIACRNFWHTWVEFVAKCSLFLDIVCVSVNRNINDAIRLDFRFLTIRFKKNFGFDCKLTSPNEISLLLRRRVDELLHEY